ncbi:COMPASS component SHG1 [Kluyveromyces marxianus]|uniref:COMPASS component SHG1 n=2 Tax=Kluyveromyces marxianus TaxID=4911 RepID=W0TAT3_KLUMD|nr:COMPASS component SHG1 [Kluyveromyces marxianus DMKU3-1042]QGN16476.1 COMPASS component SHG1 [Kluyveromyces marxianus]BAO40747.1 COMPASS component SHG1 [Kluyveromyces marxianus DMKU3-1042]BAP72220.1 COMPASS component SHG1 [Kluyveromyces marxianus]
MSNLEKSQNESLDPAKDLADAFKKEGHLDKMKNEILSQNLKDDMNLEQFIREQVKKLVRSKVQEDESLVFKNRGTTTALLEGQLFKDGFKSLNTAEVDIENLLDVSLNSNVLEKQIRDILEAKIDNK